MAYLALIAMIVLRHKTINSITQLIDYSYIVTHFSQIGKLFSVYINNPVTIYAIIWHSAVIQLAVRSNPLTAINRDRVRPALF